MDTLLIITSRYPHAKDSVSGVFVYSQVQELKKQFKKIIVICTLPYIPKVLTKLMSPNRAIDSLAEDYSYDNVSVFFIRSFIPPIERLKSSRGEKSFQKTVKLISLKDIRPDMVHAHYAWPSGYIALRLKEKFKWPYVVTGHGYDVYELPFRSQFYLDTVKRVLEQADGIITVSNENKRVMIEKLGVSEQEIHVIPNGYNPKIFYKMDRMECRKKLKLPAERKIVLSVGYLAPEKGQIYLVESAKAVIQKNKNILFIVAGEGTDRQKLENKIKEYNLKDNFILVGKKPHQEIPLWMNAADLLVIPSLFEGVPTVLFEALSCGLPIVSTSVGGVPDIITNNHYGILTPPKDAGSLSNAITNSLARDWDSEEIIEYSKKFTWDKISTANYNLYMKVLTHNDEIK